MDEKIGDRVFVSKGRTMNLGNYNSVRWEYGYSVTVAEGESPQEAKERAETMVDKWNQEEEESWANK